MKTGFCLCARIRRCFINNFGQMTGNDARSQATPQRPTVWSAQERGTCTIDYYTGDKKCTEASFTTEGIRLMKHRLSLSYYSSSKKLATTLQWKPGKLNFPLKRKNWPELSKLALSFTLKEEHSPPNTLINANTCIGDSPDTDWCQTLGSSSYLGISHQLQQRPSNSNCFKWAPIIAPIITA